MKILSGKSKLVMCSLSVFGIIITITAFAIFYKNREKIGSSDQPANIAKELAKNKSSVSGKSPLTPNSRIEADKIISELDILCASQSNKNKDQLKQENLLRELFKIDIELAKEWVSKNESGIVVLAKIWAESDPDAATEWALNIDGFFHRGEALKAIAGVMANKDIDVAMDWLGKLSVDNGNKVFPIIMKGWAKRDLEAATKWVEMQFKEEETEGKNLKTRKRFILGLGIVAVEWVNKDPAVGADLLLRYSKENGIGIKGFLTKWLKDDYNSAANWAMQLPEQTFIDHAIGPVLSVLMEKDFEAAKEWVKKFSSIGGKFDPKMMEFVKRWSAEDPSSVINWAIQLKGDNSWPIRYAVEEWARKDLESAKNWVMQMDPVKYPGQKKAIEAAASAFSLELAKKDPLAAAEWAIKLNEDIYFSPLFSVLGEWARNDPEAAKIWVLQMEAGEYKNSAINSLTHNLMMKDKDSTLSWVRSLESGIGKDKALNVCIFKSCFDGNISIALELSNEIHERHEKNMAFSHMSHFLAERGPEKAMEFLNTVQDLLVQKELMREVYSDLKISDIKQAQQFLDDPNFDKSLRDEIMKEARPVVKLP